MGEGARPISKMPAGLVSPVDGRVLASGVIRNANTRVEQVKGATYSVPAFLGLDPVEFKAEKSVIRYVVLYLAPGDYHRIHAPCGQVLAGQALLRGVNPSEAEHPQKCRRHFRGERACRAFWRVGLWTDASRSSGRHERRQHLPRFRREAQDEQAPGHRSAL